MTVNNACINTASRIITKDGKHYCTICKRYIKSARESAVKAHLESKEHADCLSKEGRRLRVSERLKVSFCTSFNL